MCCLPTALAQLTGLRWLALRMDNRSAFGKESYAALPLLAWLPDVELSFRAYLADQRSMVPLAHMR
jgi:hypothetical protein